MCGFCVDEVGGYIFVGVLLLLVYVCVVIVVVWVWWTSFLVIGL